MAFGGNPRLLAQGHFGRLRLLSVWVSSAPMAHGTMYYVAYPSAWVLSAACLSQHPDKSKLPGSVGSRRVGSPWSSDNSIRWQAVPCRVRKPPDMIQGGRPHVESETFRVRDTGLARLGSLESTIPDALDRYRNGLTMRCPSCVRCALIGGARWQVACLGPSPAGAWLLGAPLLVHEY